MKTALPRSHKDLPKDFDELVHVHTPRAISDGAEYEETQEMIDRLTSIPKLSEGQKEYLDTLTILLEAYEQEHDPLEGKEVTGLGALKYLMEQNDLSASDLGRLLGDRALGSRILRGERALSKAHVRKLCDRFRVGPELFWDLM